MRKLGVCLASAAWLVIAGCMTVPLREAIQYDNRHIQNGDSIFEKRVQVNFQEGELILRGMRMISEEEVVLFY